MTVTTIPLRPELLPPLPGKANHMRLITALVAVLLLLTSLPNSTASQVMSEMYEVVVQLEPGTDVESAAAGFVTAANVPVESQCWTDDAKVGQTCRLNHQYELVITGFSVFLTPFEIQRAQDLLASNELGVHAISGTTDFTMPTVADAETSLGADPLTTNEVVPAGVQRISGGIASGEGVGVAVLDTGGAIDHPDVTWGEGYDCTGNTNIDGFPDYYDGHGHGTHVAGTIAGRSNGAGVVGVAPGAVVYPVKVLTDAGSGSYASIICGLEWVAAHDDVISVANMSLGGSGWVTACGEDDPFHNAICVLTETVVVVVAAGNSGNDATDYSPANYPEVVTVSAYTDFDGEDGGFALAPDAPCRAMSDDDALASFSNDGEIVDISAPGVCVLSSIPGGGYAYNSGTSMASPHIAGCVAGFIARNPDQRDHAVDQMLTWSQSRSQTPIAGDVDGWFEPVASCNAIPRYSGV